MFAAKWLAVDSSFVLNAKFSSVTFACFTWLRRKRTCLKRCRCLNNVSLTKDGVNRNLAGEVSQYLCQKEHRVILIQSSNIAEKLLRPLKLWNSETLVAVWYHAGKQSDANLVETALNSNDESKLNGAMF
jgi:hypothetical protein